MGRCCGSLSTRHCIPDLQGLSLAAWWHTAALHGSFHADRDFPDQQEASGQSNKLDWSLAHHSGLWSYLRAIGSDSVSGFLDLSIRMEAQFPPPPHDNRFPRAGAE